MATNAQDIFAEFRTGGTPSPASVPPRPTNPDGTVIPQDNQDLFAEFRVSQQAPEIRHENTTLGEEVRAGLGQGIDSLQGSLLGVAGLAGRELGIKSLEAAGNAGARDQFEQAGNATTQTAGFSEIESAGGFFRWASNALGQAVPSLALAFTGAGIGATVGKKAIELGVKKSLARRVERDLTSRFGFERGEALAAARDLMTSPTGQKMITEAFVGRSGAVISKAAVKATKIGGAAGAFIASSLPQIGEIDQELLSSGVADPGLTALLGGIAGGALEAVPALRLLDKMFPGVDKQVSKQFVKDFAVSTGTQAALEGSTEAAQEMIQLASLAYHDPTFDMFSPSAKRRVVDAFAAGALVGLVTGGGAEGASAVQSGAFQGTKAAAPKIKAWTFDTADKVKAAAAAVGTAANAAAEGALPDGFVPADNTVFEEIKDRVYSTIQPRVEAIVNGLQAQVQSVTDNLNDSLEAGVNAESASISQIAQAAHAKFIKEHGDQIEQAKNFMNREVARITKTAETIQDPEARTKFVQDQVDSVKEKLSGFVDMLRRKAAERDQGFEAEVDNMDFPDDVFDQFDIGQEDAPIVGQPAPGEVESPTTLTFGKFQTTPSIGVDGKESVQGYDNQEQAKKGLETLQKRFPEAKDGDFQISQQKDGTFIIETQNPDLREGQRFFDGVQAARDSASRTKSNERNNKRKITLPVDGRKFGFKFKNLTLDMVTMALRGKNLDPNAETLTDGFLAFGSELLTRGIITVDQFNEMQTKFQDNFGEEAGITFDEFAAPTNFPTEGVAKANMINFINKMKKRGIKIPFNMLNTIRNENGTFSFGIDDVRTFRALRAKSPADAQIILDEIKNERRQEQLAEGARQEGEFSGNTVLTEGGDLGDRTGATAGTARTVATAARDDVGSTIVTDTDPQADDRQTDPKSKPKEFEDRSDPSVQNRNRRAKENAKELSARDQRLLKRWARPGSVKMMLGGDTAANTQAALTSLANFVTKKLGLSNQITVIDDAGLQLLISQGLVSDPIFQQTLTDPSVKARNIRIHDNSFIYLSPKVLSDPVATTLAFGHEMGHHVYRVAQGKLTPEALDRLRKASKTDTERGFNEWMADQLAAWIARPQVPQGPAEAFFAKVGGQIRRLFDFISRNPRFQLNETFKEFADAVALQAKESVSQGANPFNEAILKSWFHNEGVTMYQWFGNAMLAKDGKTQKPARGSKTSPRSPEVDNIAFDFKPVTAEGQKALARAEKNFPAIVKRAVVLRNWMKSAYNMAIAPATSAVRDLVPRVPVANKLVLMFNRGAQGDAKVGGQNYHQSIELMRGQFMKPFIAITRGVETKILKSRPDLAKKALGNKTKVQTLVDAEMRKIGQSLQKKDGDPSATFTQEEQAIRDLFDNMHAYAIKAGLPVGKVVNYFPRSFSRKSLVANKQKILDHLTDGKGLPLAKARSLYNSLIDPTANDGRATSDATEVPGFKAMNSRHVQDKFFDQFLDDNTHGIVANYINQVIKRAEFNRRLGEAFPANTGFTAKQAIKNGLWDPKAKLNKILADAKKQGATDEDLVTLERYIDANLGQLGRDSVFAQPGARRFMAGVMAYQNMRVLLFTVFASLPDLAGPAIRNGSMRDTWTVLKNNIGELSKQDNGLDNMARSLGIIQDTMSDHIMTEYVDNHYMPAGLRRWNDNFFKYTGLNWYTDFTRKYALAVGVDYIENSYNNFVGGKTPQEQARGKDMLAELGLSPVQAKRWLAAGKPTFDSQVHDNSGDERAAAEALIQFVDESIMRPNASQRPIMASHPGAMLVFHLKGYMYAVHDIILKRLKFNVDEAQSPAQYASALAPAIAMMLLTAVGLELRELIQYAGSNRKPPTDRMDGWEYTWELAQRSGLTGFAQIGIDFEGAEDRGMSHVAGIGGPALSQAANIISRPSTQTIPKAIPIIGQIPAARSIVRNAIN